MLATTESIAIVGTDARRVDVEVHIAGGGVPSFTIVGLPNASVREAGRRTRSAMESSGFSWPARRVTVNLSPGALRKEGTHFDLPLALGVLAADASIETSSTTGWTAIGELALDGTLRPVRGALAAAISCRRQNRKGLICPLANAAEAALVEGIEVIGVTDLAQCVAFLRAQWNPPPATPPPPRTGGAVEDLNDVRGHETAKRALEVAAAGGHNLLLVGPPGSGKTMLARRLPGILPPLAKDEALEVTRVYSVAGLLTECPTLMTERPFRAPHHNVSMAGLIGGGAGMARPGEISLADCGVVFLDEVGLFRSDVLDALRAPLEDGNVRIARAGGMISYPCRFSLVAAMNPCPCGYLGDSRRACRCSQRQLELYGARLSGPLLDRFDIQVTMARVKRTQLLGRRDGECSEVVRARVQQARTMQAARYGGPGITNATAPTALLDGAIELSDTARCALGVAVESLCLSGRGVNRVLRVARTLADLHGSHDVDDDHVTEALSLRAQDRPGGIAA